MEKESRPVLEAVERNKKGHLSAWCPYCNCWHHHGEGEGDRVAHCIFHGNGRTTPFRETGYTLRKIVDPRLTSEARKDYYG